MKIEEQVKKHLVLSSKDIDELLPWEDFKYDMFWNYDDEISEKTFKECMPDIDKFKNEDWTINYPAFADEWKINIEDKIWDWNWDYIREQIEYDLNDRVKNALKEKGIIYDSLEFDFYPDEIYSINLDLDYILSRSRIDWNVVWHSNYDWFTEWETEEDWEAIAQFLKLNPWISTKEDLESAVNDCMYTGSDLKVSYRHSMKDFLDIIWSWEKDISWDMAVLHLSINWSWSPAFQLWKWVVKFDKKLDSDFDYWTWDFDWHYWIVEVYWQVMNDCY